jgi:hypothetical protein
LMISNARVARGIREQKMTKQLTFGVDPRNFSFGACAQ